MATQTKIVEWRPPEGLMAHVNAAAENLHVGLDDLLNAMFLAFEGQPFYMQRRLIWQGQNLMHRRADETAAATP